MPLKLWRHENGIWHIRGTVTVWRSGRPVSREVRRSTRTTDERTADAIRRQIENAAAEQSVTGRQPARTFEEASRAYLTGGGEARFLALPTAHLGTWRIDEIDQQAMDEAARKAYPDAATATVRRQFYAPVIAVLRAAGINTPFRRPADGGRRTFFFRPDQALAMLARISDTRFPNPWTPALATFLFANGARVSEAMALDGRDVSLAHRYAILRDTKNGEERMVPLCGRARAALSTLPNIGQKGPLFLRYDGRPYEARKARGYRLRFWERAVAEIGLDPATFTPHTARHSWATWHYSQNRDVLRLKMEGGWRSGEWERYVKLAAPGIGRAAIAAGFDFRQESDQNAGAIAENANKA